MSEKERRCADCGAPTQARDRFCIQCGGSRFAVGAAQRIMAAPIIVCTRCCARIDAEAAWHSREAGRALCKPCKQQEETRHEP